MQKHFFYRWGFPLLACIMLLISFILAFNHSPPTTTPPLYSPSLSPFSNSISGVGMIEPATHIIQITSVIPGKIKTIYVKSGQRVQKNALLFKLEDPSLQAEVDLAKARLDSAKIALTSAHGNNKLADAKVKEAEAALTIVTTQLDKLVVKAPINGTILQVNAHEGEYIYAGKPFILLGNLDHLYVRVEIDQTDALPITSQSRAVAILPGEPSHPIQLTFVKKEPLVSSKKYLSNEGNELIDTRVVQIIYALDNKNYPVQVGQRVDVFIERKTDTPT